MLDLKDDLYSEKTSSILLRQIILYLVFPGLLLVMYTWAIKKGHAAELVKENGLIEWTQIALLAISAFFVYFASRKATVSKHLYMLVVMAPVIACIREMDAIFDRYIIDGAWQFAAAMVFVYFAFKSWKHIDSIKQAMGNFVKTTSFGYFWTGLFIVAIFARLIAQRALWQELLQERYLRIAHRFLEESCELLGYTVLVFGAVELYFDAIRERAHAPIAIATNTAKTDATQLPALNLQ